MSAETTLLVVPHTHWDREWYQTFQQFRMRLVRAVDKVLDTLEEDPSFSYFLLDGQTIVLDDYLQIRPENRERLQTLARAGRILVGPWYCQPDEFLVSGESLIRNLTIGRRMAGDYGGAMRVGYVPDCFGHIAQMPQILRGFGIDNAVFWRGVPPSIETMEWRWAAPDGSEVQVVWLGDEAGYSNAAHLPMDPAMLAARVRIIAARVKPKTRMQSYLLMNGSDHLEPQSGLPAAMSATNDLLREEGLVMRFGTLPEYVAAVRELGVTSPRWEGELRSGRYSPLLPGVYSTRMWLKQRDAATAALLSRWAEPAAALATMSGATHPTRLLDTAWRFLLQNSPHDSICGCGIDQVHREMIPRYDQADQIAEEVTSVALGELAARIDTRGPDGAIPLVVFNPNNAPATGIVRCRLYLPFGRPVITDAHGTPLAFDVTWGESNELMRTEVERAVLPVMLGMVSEGRVNEYSLTDVAVSREPGSSIVDVLITASELADPNLEQLNTAAQDLLKMSEDETISGFRILARTAGEADLTVHVADLPALGHTVLHVRPESAAGAITPTTSVLATPVSIENEHLAVMVDAATGTLTLVDKRRDATYRGLNAVLDAGDVGDLYTHCPPATDRAVTTPAATPEISLVASGVAHATLRIRRVYDLPASCSPDRQARSEETVPCVITSDVTLMAGSPRLEVHTSVENSVRDHRLRVVFPLPFTIDHADTEGTFSVPRRPATEAQPPAGEAKAWAEPPQNAQPQKRFVAANDGSRGLAVLNRGLAEYEILDERAIGLTLLRCVEWLSRADLPTRPNHAGPMIYTPEAQGIGTHVFDYALVPHGAAWHAENALVLREAEAFEAAPRVLPTTQHEGTLPATHSYASVTPADVLVSTLTHGDGGALLRLVNLRDAAQTATVHWAPPHGAVTATDLAGDALPAGEATARIRQREGETLVELHPGEIRTLRFGA
jgi:mannosylglycerate hydrolase